MMSIKTPLELYQFLPKSNCGLCQVPSCMAFAVGIIQGRKQLTDCPHLERDTLLRLGGDLEKRQFLRDDQEKIIRQLQEQIVGLDFSTATARLGARLVQDRLAINCLGKDFCIAPGGAMLSECHANAWILIPLYNYVLHAQGKEVQGKWTPFGELPDSVNWSKFFAHRCEEPLQQLADAHPDLVFEILHVFGAKSLPGITSADQALVIYPLPKLPLLINYWQPEDGFPSQLNILFDQSATANLNPECIYLLTRGLVEMFRQLIIRHSRDGKLF